MMGFDMTVHIHATTYICFEDCYIHDRKLVILEVSATSSSAITRSTTLAPTMHDARTPRPCLVSIVYPILKEGGLRAVSSIPSAQWQPFGCTCSQSLQ